MGDADGSHDLEVGVGDPLAQQVDPGCFEGEAAFAEGDRPGPVVREPAGEQGQARIPRDAHIGQDVEVGQIVPEDDGLDRGDGDVETDVPDGRGKLALRLGPTVRSEAEDGSAGGDVLAEEPPEDLHASAQGPGPFGAGQAEGDVRRRMEARRIFERKAKGFDGEAAGGRGRAEKALETALDANRTAVGRAVELGDRETRSVDRELRGDAVEDEGEIAAPDEAVRDQDLPGQRGGVRVAADVDVRPEPSPDGQTGEERREDRGVQVGVKASRERRPARHWSDGPAA